MSRGKCGVFCVFSVKNGKNGLYFGALWRAAAKTYAGGHSSSAVSLSASQRS
jgi:hypothetical protein